MPTECQSCECPLEQSLGASSEFLHLRAFILTVFVLLAANDQAEYLAFYL